MIDGLDNAAMPIVGGEYAKQLLESEPMAYESMMQALKSFQEHQPSVSQLAALQSLRSVIGQKTICIRSIIYEPERRLNRYLRKLGIGLLTIRILTYGGTARLESQGI